ncbi:MAG TPA: hypothetical protein VFV99_13830 [Kofleriaceae bacterium]|nr:hypothetical protein [Kofleriaceae bacterium]
MKRVQVDWIVLITALFFAFGCGGGGCGGCGMEPIPGGFPSAKRNPNAGQLRVTQSGLAAVSANPASLLGALGGAMNGVLKFNAPANCGGSTPICCPGGNPVNPCGPIDIDLKMYPGDQPRLVLAPASGASRLDVTVRARVKTEMDIPVSVPLVGDCGVKIDTSAGSVKDIRIDVPITFAQDATAGTTRVVVGTVNLTQLASEDVSLTGGIGCQLANLGLSFFLGILTDQITGAVQSAIQDQTCKACESGNVAECGPFATACTDKVCMEGNECLQELGIAGRMRGSLLFASLSPGTTGAMDLYEVAGGYATTNNNGIALGLLGGMQPGGAARDKCGPPATDPGLVTIPQSTFFQGNTRPDNGQAFDVGIGLHKSQLAQLAYAGYDGGLFCLTIGASFAAQLSTDTISLLSRSLGKLVESNSPMAVGLRPQSPPTIILGKNTFKDDGMGNQVIDVPLLDISFKALEIDFFAMVDEQYIRVFTVVADVHLPIGLQTTGMGQLQPVIGSTMDAFTNITVKNNDAITESPAELAGLFPTLLELALPQLSSGIGPISLPELGGLKLNVTAITAVDNDSFLAIFANLAPGSMMAVAPVDTTVELAQVTEPADAVMRDIKQWESHKPPSVTLALSGSAPDLEYSYRVDDGSWSAWSASQRQTLSSRVFWLPGVHKVAVRSRQIGHPETLDPEPAVVELPIGTGNSLPVVARSDFHGQAGASGCSCETSSGSSGALFALVIGLIVLPTRRMRRRLRNLVIAGLRNGLRLGPIVWLTALALLPGCDCGNPCGSSDCLPGDVERGAIGRWTSIAGDDKRVMVATYDQVLGDLVVVDATDQGALKYVAVDGVPDITPTHDPDTYRGGVEDAGPNIGAWTSIALANGHAAVAYQDRDEKSLKYARETKPGSWKNHVIDGGDLEIGAYASLVFDADKRPAIAYIALGKDDGMGHRITELRLARSTSTEPDGADEWQSTVIASAPGSCGGLCGSDACIAGAAATDPQVCVTPSTDCTATCANDEVCSAGACTAVITEPKLLEPPLGTGLWVSLVVLPDGRLAAAYYDQSKRALTLAVEGGKGTSQFTETILDGNVTGADRGMWSSAVVGNDGTIHIAYQDALGDQLMYTTWSGAPGTPEVVDDGQRPGDRTHPVGAAASIYLNNATPSIAYQDGMTSDVYVATKGGAWTPSPLAQGPLLDGFSIGATTGHGTPVIAWGSMDPAQSPPTLLTVRSP